MHPVVRRDVVRRGDTHCLPGRLNQRQSARVVVEFALKVCGRNCSLSEVVDALESTTFATDHVADVQEPLRCDLYFGPVPPGAAIVGAAQLTCRQRPFAREAVSYTHLRAHETGRNLVCRLLL